MVSASFSQIKNKIQQQIDLSKRSILISVAWFTNKELLGILTDKLDTGCKVEIIISDHFENEKLSYSKFMEKGGLVYIFPSQSGKFLHDKFALFDDNKLIAGSYNWTNRAEYSNHEFIILCDESLLIKQFSIRFENLRKIAMTYDKLHFSDKQNILTEAKEDQLIMLEEELEQEFIKTIEEANSLGAKINTTYVLDYIHNYGAIGAASRLVKIGTNKFQSGLLKLWEINRLDISFESIMLKEKYSTLFDKNILENAQKRLNELKAR